MKLVYIASAYVGNIEKNIKDAQRYCLDAMKKGYVPVAPHLLYPQFLDDSDPGQRNIGMQAGLELLTRCDELWIYGAEVTPGMSREIAFAKGLGIGVRRMYPEPVLDQKVMA